MTVIPNVEFGFVADRKTWDEQCIVPGFAVRFCPDFPTLESGEILKNKEILP